MMATPALSSAPRSVVPSVVMRVAPIRFASSGLSATRIILVGSPGNGISPPAYCAITCGLTFAPLVSGDVSRCALNATTGTSCDTLAGTVAMTSPCSSCCTSLSPKADSSLSQHASQFQLAGRAGIGRGGVVRRGLDGHVAEKSLQESFTVHQGIPSRLHVARRTGFCYVKVHHPAAPGHGKGGSRGCTGRALSGV